MHISEIILQQHRFPTREWYPFSLPVLQKTPRLALSSPVTLFVGENGTGKSTLLRAVCRKCGIYIWEGMPRSRVTANPYENALYGAIDVVWTNGRTPGSYFGSDVFRHFAQTVDDWASTDPGQLEYYGGKSLLTQSHGQSLMAYFQTRYKVKGVHLLDEPETALSPTSQIRLLRLLKAAAQAGHAQFLIATHSPILMACPGAQILSFDHVPVKTIPYEKTRHYQIYHRFMSNPRAYLDSET